MVPNNRIPTHPGEILIEVFLKPAGITQLDFAKHIGISSQLLRDIVRERQSITPELAWRFSQALGTTPEFWTNLQISYDLAIC